jgi:hypothetical protein
MTTAQQSSQPYDAIKIAKQWLRLGVRPIPLRPETKIPGPKNWTKLRIKKTDVADHFSTTDNVGGLWGSPSGWIVDLDIDLDEATQLAPYLLPNTLIYGRKSHTSSHYLFRSDGAKSIKCRTRTLGSIIELRSTGLQSVLPPSVHPEGETYEIEKNTEIVEIPHAQLTRLVQQLAAAAVFVKRYPEKGARHDYIHAITGALMFDGWNPDKVTKFMRAIVTVAGTKDSEIAQRFETVENTVRRFGEGGKTNGWKTIKEWIDEDEVRLLQGWLGIWKQITITPITKIDSKQKFSAAPKTPYERFKPEWLEVPGLCGELLAAAKRRAFTQQPLFDLATALMTMALISGNRYVVEGWDTPLQPYMMLLAPTAGGKESALDNLYFFARKLGLHETLFQGFQSYQAMLDKLMQPPNIVCWMWDEAARKLKTANKQTSGQDYQVLTWFLKLYGKGNSHTPGLPARGHAITAIDHPFFLTFAASQPSQMLDAVSHSDIDTGMLSRFVLFDIGENFPASNTDRKPIFPAKVLDAHEAIKNLTLPGGDSPFISIGFKTNEAWIMFRDLEATARERAFSGGPHTIWGRANQNALIFAGLIAIGVDSKKPTITLAIAKWAVDFISWTCDCWEFRLMHSASKTEVEKRSKKVEGLVRNAHALAKMTVYPDRTTKLMERGYLPRTALIRLCREMRSIDLDDAILQLINSDIISAGEVDGIDVLFPKE